MQNAFSNVQALHILFDHKESCNRYIYIYNSKGGGTCSSHAVAQLPQVVGTTSTCHKQIIAFQCRFGFEKPFYFWSRINVLSGSIETCFWFFLCHRFNTYKVFFGFGAFFGFPVFTVDQNTKQRFKLIKFIR